MDVQRLHEWPETVAAAEAIQRRLGPLVNLGETGPEQVGLAAGLDVAYAADSDRLAAAVVVIETANFQVVAESVCVGTAAFEYLPGLFAFRELPALVTALERLETVPDLLVCDGHGIAHPRRFGLACHIGVLTDLPAVGVAKTSLLGSYEQPDGERGAWCEIRADDEVVGRVLRTRTGVRPVFVSAGHRIDLDSACRHVLDLCPRYRLPETTRAADRLCRAALRAARRT
ncbi:MAG TPA: endonuclease V [Streptosporangiaceae bacterium]|jgi:deoxyribonuclease V